LVSVQNQCSKTKPAAAYINFNSVPVITNNQLTITNGQPLILTSTELSATDQETPLVNLGFTLTGVEHGYFDTITLPGTSITVFSQQMVFNGAIRFVPENDFLLPAYNVSVSDGVLWGGPQAALVRLNTPPANTFPTIAESSNTVRNAIIGGALSGLIGFGFFVFKFCLSKRMNGALKNILVVGSSTVEQEQEEWKRETLLPVVKEVFNRFKTTSLIGYRNETNTKSYLKGVELILLEIKNHGVEVHFPKLSVTERIHLLTAIVDEINIQLVAGGSSSFIRPAFTPAALKGAAVAIAKVVAMTVKKEAVADKIRRTVVERPNRESSSYPVMVRDNEIELESVAEQKFASEASNQVLGGQSSLEARMAAIEKHFTKSEARFAKIEENSAKYEEHSAKIEASLEELLGRQPQVAREKPKMRLVK
ncbi:MAG TPA: cadherin-like domain-containing protein, partial [Gammaproteobacteria bacterium]|nr:cadherin-like domain-containing protein [Gammaproteobacteria bacterium]